MKIALIKINKETLMDKSFNIPPIGLGYVAALLEKDGHQISIIDFAFSTKEEIQGLLNSDFDLFGFSVTTFEMKEAVRFLNKIKEFNKKAIIVFGGPHVSSVEDQIMNFKNIDYAVVGEGEFTMLELARLLEQYDKFPPPERLKEVKGLIYKEDVRIIKNEPRDLISNLDSLPFPAYHLLNVYRYPHYAISTSRGCPFNCVFCYSQTFGKKWRARNAKNVLDDIEFLMDRFPRKPIHFCDDNFTLDRKRVEAICDGIINRKLRIGWSTSGVRADGLDIDLLKKMKDSGCFNIGLGIESFDAEVLENIQKGENADSIINAILMCQEVGLDIYPQFMIGNPGDNFRKVKKTIKLARKLNIFTTSTFNMATPYPKTKLWDYVEKHGRWLDRNSENYNHFSFMPVFETPEFTAKEKAKAMKIAYRIKKQNLISKDIKINFEKQITRIKKFIDIFSNPLLFIKCYQETWEYYSNLIEEKTYPKVRFYILLMRKRGCKVHKKYSNRFFMPKVVIPLIWLIIVGNWLRRNIYGFKKS